MLIHTIVIPDWFQEWGRRVLRFFWPTQAGHTPEELFLQQEEWRAVRNELRLTLQMKPTKAPLLTQQEQHRVKRIQALTKQANRNNVTRTQAYWELSQTYPELHWALLAHIVSRNGGWNMTDLQGEWLPALMSETDRMHFYRFLETANAYIFQDAYPQLLLYAESRRAGEPLFHLLPHFHVSRFMQPFWISFWRTGHSSLLTLALIINEQHYIEGRIIRHPYYQQNVLNHVLFQAQSLFQLNQVLIPHVPFLTQSSPSQKRMNLCGVVVENFSSLDERIQIGKALYGLLYQSDVLAAVLHFAKQQPHTGSRADYWPQLFAAIRHTAVPANNHAKLNGCQLLNQHDPIYSPQLHSAWNDQALTAPDRYDWFTDTDAFRYMQSPIAPAYDEMSEEHCFGLNKIEAAALLT